MHGLLCLPYDVLELILVSSGFGVSDILTLSRVCRVLHDVCRSAHVWQALYRAHFHEEIPASVSAGDGPTSTRAFEAYRERFTGPVRLKRLGRVAPDWTFNHGHAVTSARICGHTVVSASLDKTVRLMHCRTPNAMGTTTVLRPTRDREEITSMDVLPDLSLLAVAGVGGLFACVDPLAGGQLLMQARTRTAFSVRFDAPEHLVWFTGRRFLTAYDWRTPPEPVYRAHADFARDMGRVLSLAPLDGTRLAVACDRDLMIIDRRMDREPELLLQVPAVTVVDAAGGILAAASHAPPSVHLYGARAAPQPIAANRSPIALHTDGDAVVMSSGAPRGTGELNVWRTDGTPLLHVRTPRRVYAVAFDTAARMAVTGDYDGVLRFFCL